MQLNASERGTPILKTTILITVAGLLSFSTLAEEGREIVGQYTSQWSAGSFGAKGYSSPSASSGIIQGNGDFKAKKAYSSGVVEGLNRKVNLVTRKAFGFRSYETLEIALFHTMGELPEPELAHKFS